MCTRCGHESVRILSHSNKVPATQFYMVALRHTASWKTNRTNRPCHSHIGADASAHSSIAGDPHSAAASRLQLTLHIGFKLKPSISSTLIDEYSAAMAPTSLMVRKVSTVHLHQHQRRDNDTFGNWRDVDITEAYILEAWGEGFMFGALLIMAIITVANMRRGVLLHKMILLEVG